MNIRSILALTMLVTIFAGSVPDVTAATIDVGNFTLQPNSSRQEIQIFATGGEPVSALEFDIQIGDGGIALGGDDSGPAIVSLDLITNTIFASAGDASQTDVVQFPLARQSSVDVSGTVSANGLIATVVLDTTSSRPGTYDLRLTDVAGGFNTTFFNSLGEPSSTEVRNGTITVVPEACGYLPVLGMMALLFRFGLGVGPHRLSFGRSIVRSG
jgi:hypothetical protein